MRLLLLLMDGCFVPDHRAGHEGSLPLYLGSMCSAQELSQYLLAVDSTPFWLSIILLVLVVGIVLQVLLFIPSFTAAAGLATNRRLATAAGVCREVLHTAAACDWSECLKQPYRPQVRGHQLQQHVVGGSAKCGVVVVNRKERWTNRGKRGGGCVVVVVMIGCWSGLTTQCHCHTLDP